ncbi:hypothetical protein ACFLIM_10750 [Nonomuraea sp. M3C6]|uniref:Tetratricopeptide repeat-containing protein n=1 Tax=Nonomuraea marmarensis TaxID=3351344 RepID=A0ABW7A8K3_9ACTN
MDTPPHRLGLERVVEVYSGHDDLVGVTGSGYVIGADLVLSSGHVVDPDAPCQVRAPWSARWVAAEQVWRGRGEAGAVLLRVADSPWREVPGIDHVRWARPDQQGRYRLRCVARGFPGHRADPQAAETLSGLVEAPTGAVSKALTVSVLSPEAVPASLWRGMSGAVLLAEPAGQLIGVIAGYAQRRLDAVPVTALLSDERFRELAGVAPGRLETVAEGDPAVILPGMLAPAREKLPQDCPDWPLLMARHAVVPFMGRDEELAALRAWAAEPSALSIAVLTGRSGTGKTRLAGELCTELAAAGWDAGFLPLTSVCAPLAARATSLAALRPTLLVIDHPEPSSPLVGELVRRLAKHERNPRIRLLLLAREPGDAEWWRRLDTASGGWLRRLNTTTVQLNAHPLTLTERTEHALGAMNAFAPSRAALPAPPRLDDPEYGLPLRVHLAALLRLRDGDEEAGRSHGSDAEASTEPMRLRGDSGGPTSLSGGGGEPIPLFGGGAQVGDGLLSRFLARECDQWARVWPDGHERVDGVTARQAVAVLTLSAPTPAELPGLLTAVPGLHSRAMSAAGLRGRTLHVAAWLGRIFPGGERLAPLGPDLVAEQLLAETEDLDALVLAVHDHEGRTVEHLVRLLDVLRLSANREPVRSALRSLVAARIGALVTEAAAAPATRLGDVLNAALDLFPGDRELAAAVATQPEAIGAGAALSVRRDVRFGLRALDVTLGELIVRHRRATGERILLARALSVLSGRLAAVGRVGEAVVVAAESAEIFAAAPPYEEAAGRAEALFNLAAGLLLAGESGGALKPAQEAAARFRILAEDDPGYAGEAARAHHNLACALLEVGRLGEAVEAFEAAGGDTEFAANLAGVLSVLPPIHADQATTQAPDASPGATRQPPAAGAAPEPLAPFEEAGAGALPELAAGLAVAATSAVKNAAPTNRDVAHRLHLLADWLAGRDRAADALVPAAEAVVRLRGLASSEPGLRYLLAEAAGLLSRLHARRDDLDAAVRSAAEAVRNLRALVALEPDEHRPHLAGQLLDLGELLLVDDRAEEALGPLQEAMSVAAERHTATQARARQLLGLCLDEIGRPVDGLAQLEIAAELYDVLGAEGDLYLGQRSEVGVRLRRLQSVLTVDHERLGRMRPAGERGDERPWMLALVSERPPEEAVVRAEQLLAERRKVVESAGSPGVEEIHAYLSAQAMLARVWADVGRAADGFVLAMQAAELLQRHAWPDRPNAIAAPDRPHATTGPDRPHAIAVGMVAAALGRTLVALGRHKEAIPHLLTAIESYEPQTGTSLAFRLELAELVILETVALSRAACPSDAESAADRLVDLYAELVSERFQPPLALAGALRLQAGIRFTRQNVEGARQSVTRALEVMPSEPAEHLLTATCLELGGLCLAESHDNEAAGAKLAEGTALLEEQRSVPPDLVNVHLLALIRLARLRVEEEGPAAGVGLHARILQIRPLPGAEVLDILIEELSGYLDDMSGADPAGLLPSLTSFTDALEREVPLSGDPEVHDRFGECLARFSDAAAREGDAASAALGAELTVRVYRELAAVSSEYRGRLGMALAALARLANAAATAPSRAAPAGPVHPELAVLEQAVDLLGAGEPGRPLADTLNLYAVKLLEQGRPVEALAHCERAADLCDELDDPAVAAATYARLGAALALLDRPQAALEAITWSLAELNRAQEEQPHIRAQAIQVRGQVLRAFGRRQEALAHLVEAVRLFARLPDPLAAAETAAVVADDLMAEGRPEEAAEYAGIATTGHPEGTVKHALATQRLARCHMMLGALAAANTLVEGLIPQARRSPDDLTYRAILADSLAQSSELLPLLRLDGGTEAEARAREAIAIYDELLTTGMNAQALHTSRAGACLTLAAALRMRDLAADAVQPLREAVAALERFAPGNPLQAGLLSRAMLMLGDALMEAGRALEAGLVFHRGTQVTRDELSRAVAHARLGFCQQELGRDDAADAALRVSAGLLRDLVPEQRDLAELLDDVLRGRLRILEKAGDSDELRAVEDELHRLTNR